MEVFVSNEIALAIQSSVANDTMPCLGKYLTISYDGESRVLLSRFESIPFAF